MKFNEYQTAAARTAVYPRDDRELALCYTILGLGNEAGEVQGKMKKMLRGDHTDYNKFREEMIKELGDVLWYIASVATELEVSMDDIAKFNIAKLEARKNAGTIKGDGDTR